MIRIQFKLWTIVLVLLMIAMAAPLYAAEAEPNIVDNYKQSTDLQRAELMKKCANDTIEADIVVANVEEYDTFNEQVDKRGTYYKVESEMKVTPLKTQYKIICLYKNEDEVKNINKGQQMSVKGWLLRMIDEKLWISVWIYSGVKGEEEKVMFGEYGSLPKN